MCIIPVSAHGTNPASAVMAGMKIVTVSTDSLGNVNIAELQAKAEEHSNNLAALMITYPSTHGMSDAIVSVLGCQPLPGELWNDFLVARLLL